MEQLLSPERQLWIKKLSDMGFKPQLTMITSDNHPIIILQYGSIVTLKSDFKLDTLQSLYELQRLIEQNIRTIEELPHGI